MKNTLLLALGMVLIWWGTGCTAPSTKSNTAPTERVGRNAPEVSEQLMAEDQERAEQALRHLLETVRSEEYHLAADLMVYRGEDAERKWKTAYNYEDPEEQAAVDAWGMELRELSEGWDRFEVLSFAKDVQREGEWNVLETELVFEDGSRKQVVFAFLRIGNQLLLGDID